MNKRKSRTTAFVTIAVGGLLLGGSLALAPAVADDNRPPAGARQWLSIPQVHARLEAAGYRNIEKIEREHGNYEVRATDRDGRRVKLDVDGEHGDVIESRFRDERRRDARGADGTECSKRRCRDDRPTPVPAAK